MADDEQHGHHHVHAQGDGPEPVDGTFVPRPVPDLETTELDGELVLLDPRTHRLHVLDPLGTVIWRLFDGEATVDELTADLAYAFSAPAEVVGQDFVSLVAALRAASLIEGSELLVGPPAAGATAPGGPGDGQRQPAYVADPPAP